MGKVTTAVVGFFVLASFAISVASLLRPQEVQVVQVPLGAASPTEETGLKVFKNTALFQCLKTYQLAATTAASTTYYLVASTTANAQGLFPVLATTTRPNAALCPAGLSN